jgi:hypothetical protein
VKGRGITTATAAIPQLRSNQPESSNNKVVWRVLFDSGSDGDMIFLKRSERHTIDVHKRLHPQIWRTSSDTFETNKVCNTNLTLPKFSNSKIMSLMADIHFTEEGQSFPMYDLIIGLETLVNWKAISNFHDKTLTIDHVELPMQDLHSLIDSKLLNNIYTESIEPSVSRVANNRVTQILDAKYEKANLPEVVDNNCKHLTTHQQNKLLKLIVQYEELFDGTLGDWKGESGNFELKPDAKPYHGRPFPVPHIHKETIKKEVARLVEIGVLKPIQESEWASPSFIIPKKSKDPKEPGTV